MHLSLPLFPSVEQRPRRVPRSDAGGDERAFGRSVALLLRVRFADPPPTFRRCTWPRLCPGAATAPRASSWTTLACCSARTHRTSERSTSASAIHRNATEKAATTTGCDCTKRLPFAPFPPAAHPLSCSGSCGGRALRFSPRTRPRGHRPRYPVETAGGSSAIQGYAAYSEVACAVCGSTASGSVYRRWGRTACPAGHTRVHKGRVAGPHYTHDGGGGDPLCLHETPSYSGNRADAGGAQVRASVPGLPMPPPSPSPPTPAALRLSWG